MQKCELHIKITGKLPESGRDDNGISILGLTIERQKKEMKWMLTLQPVFSYGVNDKVGDEYIAETESRVVGNDSYHYIVYISFQIIITLKLSLIIFLKQSFVKIITAHLGRNSKDNGYFKKSFLKQVCNNEAYEHYKMFQIRFPK